MKIKRLLIGAAAFAALSCVLSACGFGPDKKEEQVIVEETPTPVPEEATEPDPTPTIAPDGQSTTYTSKDKSISIKLPDATWGNKTDEANLVSFESPEQGKILILHGDGAAMESTIIPDTEDTAAVLLKGEELEQDTDFQIQNYLSETVNGVNVVSYMVKMLNPEKTEGVADRVIKYFFNDTEYYNIEANVKDEGALAGVMESVNSFQILSDSVLKNGITVQAVPDETAAEPAQTEETAGGEEETPEETGNTSESTSGEFTEEQLHDTDQTRTIYRNSDGSSLVITPDGEGGWKDSSGNTYRFETDEDVYDQNEVDYYYHGEAADVYFMSPDEE